jgi:hypothetical protein
MQPWVAAFTQIMHRPSERLACFRICGLHRTVEARVAAPLSGFRCFGTPFVARDNARFDEFEPLEESSDLLGPAQVMRNPAALCV